MDARFPTRRRLAVGAATLLLGFGLLNAAAYEHARALTRFGLPYERHVFAGAHGLPIEAWLIPPRASRASCSSSTDPQR